MLIDGEMVNCTHCGESIQATAIYCPFCFSGLSQRHFGPCPSCAEVIRKDAVLCKFCKTALPPAPAIEIDPEYGEQMVADFRETFVVEIDNLITYCEKIGDALFMIVNIVGKALQVSRCLVYCSDRAQVVWTYAEYWDREAVKGCRESNWRASRSALVARTVLAKEPLIVGHEIDIPIGTSIQDELELLEIKSLLGVALGGQRRPYGCLILQQCDGPRTWTKDEIEWIENVGTTLAESLDKLENADSESD